MGDVLEYVKKSSPTVWDDVEVKLGKVIKSITPTPDGVVVEFIDGFKPDQATIDEIQKSLDDFSEKLELKQ